MGGESCGQNGKKTGGEVSRRRWARLYDEHGIPRPKKRNIDSLLRWTLETEIPYRDLGLFSRSKGLDWNGNPCGLTDSISVRFRAMEAQDVVDHPCAARFFFCRRLIFSLTHC